MVHTKMHKFLHFNFGTLLHFYCTIYKLEVALAEEHGIVLKENDKYRLSQRTIEYLIDYFMEFYKKDVQWMTRDAYKRLVEAEQELKKLQNRLGEVGDT